MKPSERIGEISKKYAHWKLEDTTPDYTGIKAQAIIDYLDEQAETTLSEKKDSWLEEHNRQKSEVCGMGKACTNGVCPKQHPGRVS